MNYAALLRGINVGGNNKVDMQQLKSIFEAAGMRSVRTYINSGNVLFEYEIESPTELAGMIEEYIEKEFGFTVSVLVKSETVMQEIVGVVPKEWRNDATMKCDVVFLWDGISVEAVVVQLKARKGIDEIRTAPGAIVWKVDRENVTKSGLTKIIGTPLYKQATVRNINTTRKLVALLQE